MHAYSSDTAPKPAGTYSVATSAMGFVFLAGQTPRDHQGKRHGDASFAVQAKMTLDKLEASANAAGLSLRHAVKINVFLKDPTHAKEFDNIYAEYVSDPLPARTLVQSGLIGFDIEIDAILAVPQS